MELGCEGGSVGMLMMKVKEMQMPLLNISEKKLFFVSTPGAMITNYVVFFLFVSVCLISIKINLIKVI